MLVLKPFNLVFWKGMENLFRIGVGTLSVVSQSNFDLNDAPPLIHLTEQIPAGTHHDLQ